MLTNHLYHTWIQPTFEPFPGEAGCLRLGMVLADWAVVL